MTTSTSSNSEVIVLLVDDQMIVAQAVHRLFAEDQDIRLHYCASPEQALEKAIMLSPTVILQDLVMPGVSGLDLVRQYRATPATSEIPIIVLSTKEDPVTKSHAFAEGANDYLVKLPDRIELVARIRYHSRAYRAMSALREQATRDGLTGLWNRNMIFDVLGRELARASRDGSALSIMMADLDRFKSINDNFGHTVGDAVLKEAARRMNACVRVYDHVGRYGGEEFLIVLPNTRGEHAQSLGERLRRAIADVPLNTEGMEVPITCSFGIAFTDKPHANSLMELVQAADRALYLAKQNGRDRVELAPEALVEALPPV